MPILPRMSDIDLNLLTALDVLLAECSVTAAARRLGLSPSAMSRTLGRLRAATGDPLLVQAGRRLVPTPYAQALAGRVPALARDVHAVLSPAGGRIDLSSLERTFTIRAGEGFVELVGASLMAALLQAAPKARLRFAPKPDRDAAPLRDGVIDLEIGVIGTSAPEVRAQMLFRDRSVGVVRAGHRLVSGLASGQAVTAEAYTACDHLIVSREGAFVEPIDAVLDAIGLKRHVVLVVPSHPDAMRIVRACDLVAVIPHSCLGNHLAGDHAARMGLHVFELPVPVPGFGISAIWHPRFDADPAHRFLRDTVAAVGKRAYG